MNMNKETKHFLASLKELEGLKHWGIRINRLLDQGFRRFDIIAKVGPAIQASFVKGYKESDIPIIHKMALEFYADKINFSHVATELVEEIAKGRE